MTDLEEVYKLVHYHLVVLFLLVDKHDMILSREGIEKEKDFLLLSYH